MGISVQSLRKARQRRYMFEAVVHGKQMRDEKRAEIVQYLTETRERATKNPPIWIEPEKPKQE
jgi:hypothetical protein